MRRKRRASNDFGAGAAGFRPSNRFERFFVECLREFHYRRGLY
jgi:hypothetical protein